MKLRFTAVARCEYRDANGRCGERFVVDGDAVEGGLDAFAAMAATVARQLGWRMGGVCFCPKHSSPSVADVARELAVASGMSFAQAIARVLQRIEKYKRLRSAGVDSAFRIADAILSEFDRAA